MVTEEDIKQMELAEQAIDQKYKQNHLLKEDVTFHTLEDVCKYYDAEPFEEFNKKFRSGR